MDPTWWNAEPGALRSDHSEERIYDDNEELVIDELTESWGEWWRDHTLSREEHFGHIDEGNSCRKSMHQPSTLSV